MASVAQPETSAARPGPRSRLSLLLLILVLAAATILRFTALAHGQRHAPHMDERDFVEAVAQMLAQHDFDHRFYEYPGLLFYILYPVLALVPASALHANAQLDPAAAAPAYLAARAVIAAFGVLSVGLVYALGRRVIDRTAALAAAALLAVSSLDVYNAHFLRPDVVLGSFVLLALLAQQRLGERRRDDVWAGATLGLAGAVKFTALLLVPSYLAQRALAPGFRWTRPLLAGAVALAVFVAVSPYTLIHWTAASAGATSQILQHYGPQAADAPGYVERILIYARVWPKALGWPTVALAAAGLLAERRRWRIWLPLLLYVGVSLAIIASSPRKIERLLLPTIPVVALLAGACVSHVSQRWPRGAALLALATLAWPLWMSVDYVRAESQPATRDRAVDWLAANARPGARVLTTLPELGFERGRFEVVRTERLDERNAALLRDVEWLVTTPATDPRITAPCPLAFAIAPDHPAQGPPIEIRRMPAATRGGDVVVPLDDAVLDASQNAAGLAALRDGRFDTAWESETNQEPGMWIEVRLPRAVRLAAVELALGTTPRGWAKRLALAVPRDGHWQRIPVVLSSPPVSEQASDARGQRLVLEPLELRTFRVLQLGRAPRAWRIAELRVFGEADSAARHTTSSESPQ